MGLIRDSEETMYRVARSILKSDEACADAIQEAIVRAYGSIEGLKEPRYFRTWLIRILINVCKQMHQSSKKVVLLEEWIEQQPDQSDSYERVEIQEAVDALEDEFRVVVTLFYFEDLSVREIAQSLDLREGTVKSRLNRARAKLAAWLGHDRKSAKGGLK